MTRDAPMHAPLNGLVEGFYGVYYTHPERISLIGFLARHGFGHYVYAPKNDRHHRKRWREPYPRSAMEQFGRTVRFAREQGVEFWYSLSPGIDVCYSDESDFAAITAKLAAFQDLGVRSFGLLLDDIRNAFRYERDAERYGTFAAAQADLCNRVHAWLLERDPSARLAMCPTDYHGAPPFAPSLHELGERLHPAIDVFYTGTEVCSSSVGRFEVDAFAAALKRPPILWDNYPVNDLAMQGELHVGPVRGRASDLPAGLRGLMANPMNQAEASKIALATFGDYLADPACYDPDESWERALAEVAGDSAPALGLVAENSLRSCLGTPEAARLEELVGAVLGGPDSDDAREEATDELHDYLQALDEACYELRYRMTNLDLRTELLPWLDLLDEWSWLGRWSIEALRDRAAGRSHSDLLRRIEDCLARIDAHPKRIAGDHLRPLALLALGRDPESIRMTGASPAPEGTLQP